MSKINRADFLEKVIPGINQIERTDAAGLDPLVKKYGNTSLPLSVKKSRSTLSPYAGNWGTKQKIHLLRRCTFGVKAADLNALNSMTVTQAVDALLNTTNATPFTPINYYQNTQADNQGIAYGQTWVNAPYNNDGTINYYRYLSVRTAWFHNIFNQPLSIEEKMIVFWHNHFAMQYSMVGDARLFHEQLVLLRQHALGNFKTFVKEITKNGMMLIYLNGAWNHKWAPDENYARELQELFTLGKGPNMYTEDDIKRAARVLTGFRLDLNVSYSYFFDSGWHDDLNKTFSSFYSGTVINGQSGPAGENELDDLLNMIFAKDTIVAKFIVRKLYRYFMHYDIDSDIENNIITPLAQTFITNNWNIKPVLEQLLKSDHFFDPLNMDAVIRNPMDFYLGFLSTAKVNFPPVANHEVYHQALATIGYILDSMAMNPGDPPSVAGWSAYYQTPYFHQLWINSDTISKRMSYVDNLFYPWGQWVGPNQTITSDVIAFAQQCSNPGDPDILLDFFIDRLVSFGFSVATKNNLKSILLSGQATNSYWTQAWFDYMAQPTNTMLEGIVLSRLRNVLLQICRSAEHQIS
jgi:uncharacterized protein (DUF1800 family)